MTNESFISIWLIHSSSDPSVRHQDEQDDCISQAGGAVVGIAVHVNSCSRSNLDSRGQRGVQCKQHHVFQHQ